MACEAEKDLEFLASISRKLDMIEHLQHRVQDIKEAHRVELKEVIICLFLCSILTVTWSQSATHIMGEALWDSIMQPD